MTTIGDDVQPVILSNMQHSSESAYNIINDEAVRPLAKYVIRAKLQKMRHLVIQRAIHPEYLESIFPDIIRLFKPQHVQYNQGVDWKISCYLEVMPGGVPCTNPSEKMLLLCKPLLENCNHLFRQWYLQQHANVECIEVRRLMTFITRYTATPGEQALLKHVDGAGKVDGSVVVALPMDPDEPFEGYGGGLTFWDGKETKQRGIDYSTRCGDIAFIDRAVWHQANPITSGRRWAMVIFYKVERSEVSN